jgi:Enoyl-CoA hydratase/isomerase
LEVRGGPVTTITLNRPECHNALDREVSAELNAAVKEISVERGLSHRDPSRGWWHVLRAGDDVKEFNNWEPTDFIWQVRMYQETVTMIDNLVPVTIAAVDGVWTGGGLELTSGGRFRRCHQPLPVGHAGDQLGHHSGLAWHREDRQVRGAAKSQGVAHHRPSRPSRETLRMFALNPKPRLKPRFVFDSASIGLGYRHLKPTFNRAPISAQWCRRISQRIFTPETRDSRLYELYAL